MLRNLLRVAHARARFSAIKRHPLFLDPSVPDSLKPSDFLVQCLAYSDFPAYRAQWQGSHRDVEDLRSVHPGRAHPQGHYGWNPRPAPSSRPRARLAPNPRERIPLGPSPAGFQKQRLQIVHRLRVLPHLAALRNPAQPALEPRLVHLLHPLPRRGLPRPPIIPPKLPNRHNVAHRSGRRERKSTWRGHCRRLGLLHGTPLPPNVEEEDFCGWGGVWTHIGGHQDEGQVCGCWGGGGQVSGS